MNTPGLVHSVANRTPTRMDLSNRNVYQIMYINRWCIALYLLAWVLILLAATKTNTGIAIFAVALMFPLSIVAIGFLQMWPRHVQAKMLTRVLEPGGPAWNRLAMAYTNRGSKFTAIGWFLVYPLILPFLVIQDALRVLNYLGRKIKGENIKFGGDEYLFYQKQAKAYNRIRSQKGLDAAEDFLMFTSVLTDTPNAAQISREDWFGGIRDDIVKYKAARYGQLSDYGQ